MTKKSLIKLFIYVNISLYFLFLLTDIYNEDSYNYISICLKYSTILLCFVLSLFIGNEYINKTDLLLLQAGRFFTLLADLFLVLSGNLFLGVLFFIIVQYSYLFRLLDKKSSKIISIILSLFLMPIFLVFSYRLSDISLFIIALYYGLLLLTNLILASIKHKHHHLIFWGMLLFCLCDINVALYNLSSNFNLNTLSFIPFSFLIWLFYFPSQILLTLSGFKPSYLKTLF
jgi:hypothetical protein